MSPVRITPKMRTFIILATKLAVFSLKTNHFAPYLHRGHFPSNFWISPNTNNIKEPCLLFFYYSNAQNHLVYSSSSFGRVKWVLSQYMCLHLLSLSHPVCPSLSPYIITASATRLSFTWKGNQQPQIPGRNRQQYTPLGCHPECPCSCPCPCPQSFVQHYSQSLE